jgi:hypothetical protein
MRDALRGLPEPLQAAGAFASGPHWRRKPHRPGGRICLPMVLPFHVVSMAAIPPSLCEPWRGKPADKWVGCVNPNLPGDQRRRRSRPPASRIPASALVGSGTNAAPV